MNSKLIRHASVMLVCLFLVAGSLGAQEDRLALVIGNSAYSGSALLKNAVNDARAVAEKLRTLQWDVTLITDADITGLEDSINQFGDKLRTKKSPTVVFYYAGHGVEVDKVNYLVPIGAEKVDDPRRLKREAYSFQDLARLLEDSGAWSSIYILDACRDDPFPKKPDTRGMVVVRPVGITTLDSGPLVKGGSISLFSASSGETSSDGQGRNGLFTEALLRRMDSRESLIQIFSQVRNDVVSSTNGRQNPRLGDVALTDLSMNFLGSQVRNSGQPSTVIPSTGYMVITSKTAGRVFVNGEDYGEVTPGMVLREPLEVGNHTVRFVPKDGSAQQEKQLNIPRGGSERNLEFTTPLEGTPLVVPLPSPSSSEATAIAPEVSRALENRQGILARIRYKKDQAGLPGWINTAGWWSFWGGAGVGGLSFTLGTVTLSSYKSSTDPETLAAYRESLQRWDQWTKIGILTSGSGLITAVITGFFLPDTSSEEEELRTAEAEIIRLGGKY